MTPTSPAVAYRPFVLELADRVERFVRDVVVPYEADRRRDHHGGPTEELVEELREKARNAGVLTPHVLEDGSHLTQRETALVLRKSGLSPLGPLACNTNAPDEGNMYLLAKVGSAELQERFLKPLVEGRARSAFFMTEPAEDGACMFLADLPDPAIRTERVPNTIDNSMPGGHAVVAIDNLRLPASQMLGEIGDGFKYAQVRLSPARLSHCMRWLGACIRANEIATEYVCRRQAFGKALIDHEGVGFMLADNLIDLKQSDLIIDWCADVLDTGSQGIPESSMAKVAVSEALMRVADRCVQVMGGTGVSDDTVVEQIFREIRAFRIYDGPTEVHKWSLAKKIKREWKGTQA